MYIDNIFVNSLNNRPCINITDRKKKREVRNHFGFALEDGKINKLVGSFLLIYKMCIKEQQEPVMHACFHKDFNIYQYRFIVIYRDIFYQYIDTPNVESLTAMLTSLVV